MKMDILKNINSAFKVLVVLASCIAACSSQEMPLSISGLIVGETGTPLPGVSVSLIGINVPNVNVSTITNEKGVYSFTDIKLGNYQICPQAPDFDLISPCDWNESSPQISINSTERGEVPNIIMKSGARVLIRLNDEFGIRASAKSISDLHAFISYKTANHIVPATYLSDDGKGSNYEIVIPYDIEVRVYVISSSLLLKGVDGKSVSSTSETLKVNRSDSQKVMNFSIVEKVESK